MIRPTTRVSVEVLYAILIFFNIWQDSIILLSAIFSKMWLHTGFVVDGDLVFWENSSMYIAFNFWQPLLNVFKVSIFGILFSHESVFVGRLTSTVLVDELQERFQSWGHGRQFFKALLSSASLLVDQVTISIECELASLILVLSIFAEQVLIDLHRSYMPFIWLQIEAVNLPSELDIFFFADGSELHHERDQHFDCLGGELNLWLHRLLSQVQNFS